jgi:mono/diheme cytochrome c family protein
MGVWVALSGRRETADGRRPALITTILLASCISGAASQTAPPSIRYDQHVAVAGKQPPASTLQNPFRGDSIISAQGSQLFSGFNCDGCHGGGAVGAVGPGLTDGRWRYGGSDGALFMSIFYGRARGMPAFGGTLPAESIWRLVTYLQSFQPPDSTIATTRW